jgi:hypothetical protein
MRVTRTGFSNPPGRSVAVPSHEEEVADRALEWL